MSDREAEVRAWLEPTIEATYNATRHDGTRPWSELGEAHRGSVRRFAAALLDFADHERQRGGAGARRGGGKPRQVNHHLCDRAMRISDDALTEIANWPGTMNSANVRNVALQALHAIAALAAARAKGKVEP